MSWPLAVALFQAANPQLPPTSTAVFLIATGIKMVIVFTVLMIGIALLTLAERKFSAWIQDRHGPNRVGFHGLGQPFADGLKTIMKEETYPAAAYKPLFVRAPALAVIAALRACAVRALAAPLPASAGRKTYTCSARCRARCCRSNGARRPSSSTLGRCEHGSSSRALLSMTNTRAFGSCTWALMR